MDSGNYLPGLNHPHRGSLGAQGLSVGYFIQHNVAYGAGALLQALAKLLVPFVGANRLTACADHVAVAVGERMDVNYRGFGCYYPATVCDLRTSPSYRVNNRELRGRSAVSQQTDTASASVKDVYVKYDCDASIDVVFRPWQMFRFALSR